LSKERSRLLLRAHDRREKNWGRGGGKKEADDQISYEGNGYFDTSRLQNNVKSCRSKTRGQLRSMSRGDGKKVEEL